MVVLPLLGLGLHAYWLAPLYTGSAPSADPEATPLTVMTVNLEGGAAVITRSWTPLGARTSTCWCWRT